MLHQPPHLALDAPEPRHLCLTRVVIVRRVLGRYQILAIARLRPCSRHRDMTGQRRGIVHLIPGKQPGDGLPETITHAARKGQGGALAGQLVGLVQAFLTCGQKALKPHPDSEVEFWHVGNLTACGTSPSQGEV